MNRGEAYHRFREAVAYVNSGKLRVQSEAEQQLWNEYSCLIANAITFNNTALLSKIYNHKRAFHDENAIEILRGAATPAIRSERRATGPSQLHGRRNPD